MSSNQNLEIVLSLLRALSHKIRTPLSVISNDLSYFKTLIEPSDCERGILKCRQISDFFKPMQLLQNENGGNENFNLLELLKEVLGEKLKTSNVESNLTLNGIRDNLLQAFNWILELFEVCEVTIKNCEGIKTEVNFKLLKPLKLLSDVVSNTSHRQLLTVTSIYSCEAVDDSILPMLIDSVLLSFSAECSLVNDSEISFVFAEVKQ